MYIYIMVHWSNKYWLSEKILFVQQKAWKIKKKKKICVYLKIHTYICVVHISNTLENHTNFELLAHLNKFPWAISLKSRFSNYVSTIKSHWAAPYVCLHMCVAYFVRANTCFVARAKDNRKLLSTATGVR